jgi:hypothetical protein
VGGFLQGLKVTMKKHPSCFKVLGHLVALVESVKEDPVILYEGKVLGCKLRFGLWSHYAAAP